MSLSLTKGFSDVRKGDALSDIPEVVFGADFACQNPT